MELHKYQKDVASSVVNTIKENKSYLMALDRGLGKTFISLNLVLIIKSERKKIKVLIVVKAGTLKDPWMNELNRVSKDHQISFVKLHGRNLLDYKW